LKTRLEAGEDFGQLARTYSKDDKASNGGDWGFYDWQNLSPAEIQAANQLEPGQLSPVIDLGQAVAILKVTEKMPEITRSLAEVKAMIQNQLMEDKARDKASQRMDNLAKVAKKAKKLEEASQKRGAEACRILAGLKMVTPCRLLIHPEPSARFSLNSRKAKSHRLFLPMKAWL